MRSDVTEVLDEGTTLLALQVRNKPALLGLRKLNRSPVQHSKADPGPRHSLFRVRDSGHGVATCGGWSSLRGELGSCLSGGDRCCPLRSGCSWPECGPDVAPAITSLEGASGPVVPA